MLLSKPVFIPAAMFAIALLGYAQNPVTYTAAQAT